MFGERPITEVPDVVGLSATDAGEIVRKAGLTPKGPGDTAAPTSGVITDQRPIGTAGAERGTVVYLWAGPGRSADSAPSPLIEVGDLDPV